MKKILTSNGKPLVKDGKVFLSSGSGSDVVVVDELPNNPEESVIYQVNEVIGIDVFCKISSGNGSTLEDSIEYMLGITPTLIYEVVDSLPSTPNVSNLQTFIPAYIYIQNDIPYVYGNAGYGNMWLEVKTLIQSATNLSLENKGYINGIDYIIEDGIYVTYKLGKLGILNKGKYILYENNEKSWIDYKSIFDKTIETYENSTIKSIPSHAFDGCTKLKNVIIPNVKLIGPFGFAFCYDLENLNLPSVETLDNSSFQTCENLKSVFIPNATFIEFNAFYYCARLRCVIIQQTDTICQKHESCFNDCFRITGEVHSKYNPNGDKDGFIYVPDSMVEQYKTNEDWQEVATQIKPLSELPQEYKDLYGI